MMISKEVSLAQKILEWLETYKSKQTFSHTVIRNLNITIVELSVCFIDGNIGFPLKTRHCEGRCAQSVANNCSNTIFSDKTLRQCNAFRVY